MQTVVLKLCQKLLTTLDMSRFLLLYEKLLVPPDAWMRPKSQTLQSMTLWCLPASADSFRVDFTGPVSTSAFIAVINFWWAHPLCVNDQSFFCLSPPPCHSWALFWHWTWSRGCSWWLVGSLLSQCAPISDPLAVPFFHCSCTQELKKRVCQMSSWCAYKISVLYVQTIAW